MTMQGVSIKLAPGIAAEVVADTNWRLTNQERFSCAQLSQSPGSRFRRFLTFHLNFVLFLFFSLCSAFSPSKLTCFRSFKTQIHTVHVLSIYHNYISFLYLRPLSHRALCNRLLTLSIVPSLSSSLVTSIVSHQAAEPQLPKKTQLTTEKKESISNGRQTPQQPSDTRGTPFSSTLSIPAPLNLVSDKKYARFHYARWPFHPPLLSCHSLLRCCRCKYGSSQESLFPEAWTLGPRRQ